MIKFVFLYYGEGYQKCITRALKDDHQAYCFKTFQSGLLRKMIRWHNIWPLNKKVELPFKSIWFERCLEGCDIAEDDEIYFLLFEAFHMTYSIHFLEYLHRKYKNARLCFMFSNPVSSYSIEKVNKISPYMDAIITFNAKDAEKYHFQYCYNQPYQVPLFKPDESIKSDLFFVGKAKGRLDKLLRIFEVITEAGLKCDFHIVEVPKKEQKYKDFITYNKRMTYEEVLQRVASTRCVLEILQNDENYISIRTSEALQYHTKLLTDSNASRNFDFYNPKIIQIFSDPRKIDVNFLRTQVGDREFRLNSLGSLEVFKEWLVSNVKKRG